MVLSMLIALIRGIPYNQEKHYKTILKQHQQFIFLKCESLKSKKIDRVIVPGGCTKYIQVPDVSWNKPFKSSCTEKYDEWLGTVRINEETAAGNLRAPPRRAIAHCRNVRALGRVCHID